jgi:hypothetical protein
LNRTKLGELAIERNTIRRNLLERRLCLSPDLFPLTRLVFADRRAKLGFLKSLATRVFVARHFDESR